MVFHVRRLAVVALAAALCGACSSSSRGGSATTTGTGSGTTVSAASLRAAWDPAAAAKIDTLVAEVTKSFPGQCADAGFLQRNSYVASSKIIKTPVPLAVADCNALNEGLEYSAFASATARAAFVSARASALCERANRQQKIGLPGLHWVVGQNWSVEPDSEGVARQLAPVLHGVYQLSACPGAGQVDWEPAAVERVGELATRLATRREVRCGDFNLLDRELYSHNPAYHNRLPAAYARCSAPGGTTIWIAAFSKATVGRDIFISSETKYFCGSQQGIEAVRGGDWAIIATQVKVAQLAAVVAAGTILPPAC